MLTCLAAFGAPAAAGGAQSWHAEFGIQSGYSRIKAAGTNARDQLDVFGVPGFSLPGLLPAGASLFAVIPWKQQIAFETSLSALQGNALNEVSNAICCF